MQKIWALSPRPKFAKELADFEEKDVRALGGESTVLKAYAVQCWRMAKQIAGVQNANGVAAGAGQQPAGGQQVVGQLGTGCRFRWFRPGDFRGAKEGAAGNGGRGCP